MMLYHDTVPFKSHSHIYIYIWHWQLIYIYSDDQVMSFKMDEILRILGALQVLIKGNDYHSDTLIQNGRNLWKENNQSQ